MDEKTLKLVNEKAYELVSRLKLKDGKYDPRSKIKSLREYRPKKDEGITDFVKNATYLLLRSKDTKDFLQELLKVINESKGKANRVEFLNYLIGYVAMSMDSIENLYNANKQIFKSSISQMLEAEFGEPKDELAEKIVSSAQQEQHFSRR